MSELYGNELYNSYLIKAVNKNNNDNIMINS